MGTVENFNSKDDKFLILDPHQVTNYYPFSEKEKWVEQSTPSI